MGAPDLTTLLDAWSRGNGEAGNQLMPLVYAELHRRAEAYLRKERRDHTLQPTALLHEAYLRLINQRAVAWQNRAHFFALAAQMMRRILVDHARRRRRDKRSGQWMRVTVDERLASRSSPEIDVLDLDGAMTRLAELDPRKARVAELRFFAGLSLPETAHVLGISVATVEREWQTARAWLYAALQGDAPL